MDIFKIATYDEQMLSITRKKKQSYTMKPTYLQNNIAVIICFYIIHPNYA